MANVIERRVRERQQLQLTLDDFTGGLVSSLSSYNLPFKYLEDINNMTLLQGKWQKRLGYHRIGSFKTSVPASSVRGLYPYYEHGNLHLLAVYGNRLYDKTSLTREGSATLVSDGLPPSNNPVRFVTFNEECYIATGRSGLLRYSGYGSSLKELDTLSGSVVAVYDNRILMAGIAVDPLAVYYSDYGLGDKWNALNYFVLDGTADEIITAMIPFHGKLFIFTNKNIFSLMGDMNNYVVTKEVGGVGAVSAEMIQIFGNRFYFASEDGRFYEFDGGNFPVDISENLTHYLRSFSLNSFKNGASTTRDKEIWFTLDNSTNPKERVTLVYYPEYRCWTKFTNIPAARYAYVDDKLLFIPNHLEGPLYHYGTQYLDEDQPIEALLKTVPINFGRLENLKRFKTLYLRGTIQGLVDPNVEDTGFSVDFFIDGKEISTLEVHPDVDENVSFWGSGIWGKMMWTDSQSQKVYQKVYLSQYNVILGKTLQIQFRDNTLQQGMRVEHMLIEFIQKGVR